MRELCRSGAEEEKIREAQRCLRLGSVRPDWQLEQKEIERRIHNAKYTRDKNYWVCMKRVGERRGGT